MRYRFADLIRNNGIPRLKDTLINEVSLPFFSHQPYLHEDSEFQRSSIAWIALRFIFRRTDAKTGHADLYTSMRTVTKEHDTLKSVDP